MRGWGSGDKASTLMQAINLSVRHTPALRCPIQSLGSTSAPPPSSQGQDGSEGLGLHWPPLYPARGRRGDRKLGMEKEGGEWRSKRKDRTGSNCRRCRIECKSADMFSVGSTAVPSFLCGARHKQLLLFPRVHDDCLSCSSPPESLGPVL